MELFGNLKNVFDTYFQIIGRVGFTSSLVNSDAPKLLSVIITTLKITRLPSPQIGSSTSNRSHNNSSTRQKLKAPTVVSNLVQVSFQSIVIECGVECAMTFGNFNLVFGNSHQ